MKFMSTHVYYIPRHKYSDKKVCYVNKTDSQIGCNSRSWNELSCL